jgi:hypothetical protein
VISSDVTDYVIAAGSFCSTFAMDKLVFILGVICDWLRTRTSADRVCRNHLSVTSRRHGSEATRSVVVGPSTRKSLGISTSYSYQIARLWKEPGIWAKLRFRDSSTFTKGKKLVFKKLSCQSIGLSLITHSEDYYTSF